MGKVVSSTKDEQKLNDVHVDPAVMKKDKNERSNQRHKDKDQGLNDKNKDIIKDEQTLLI